MQHNLQTVAKTMQILETLAESGPLGVTELSQRLGMHKSLMSKYLATLNTRRFVLKNHSGRYQVGMKNFEISQQFLERAPFRKAILPHVDMLAQETGETAYVGIMEYDHVLCLCDCVSRQVVRLGRRAGVRKEFWHDAAGKAMMAHLDSVKVFRELRKLRKTDGKNLPTVHKLKRELASARKNGYAVENEAEPGLIAVAAPLLKMGDDVSCALALGGPSSRFIEVGIDRLGRLVAERAHLASEEMGWLKPNQPQSKWRENFFGTNR